MTPRFIVMGSCAIVIIACSHVMADPASRPAPAQLGPRPFFLVDDLADGPLKSKLQACSRRGEFRPSEFSIGHRGAAMQFPEHTKESYEAAARMGAGIVECDVTFTKDKQLVCRHAQNDLHTTTNILATPLAAKCTKPFSPATFDAAGQLVSPASAECRASDVTLAEFRTLRGKMDAFDPRARTVAEYLGGTATWRTDLYAGPTSGTLMTHRESIELFKRLGVKMTPELKAPSVPMPFDGFSQAAYAQKMIDEYKQAGVPPEHVFAQSFSRDDVLYWVRHEPAFGRQAVYLDDAESVSDLPGAAELEGYKASGIQIVAPPIFALLDTRRQRQHRAVGLRAQRPGRRPRHHHVDAGTLGAACRRQQRLLLPDVRRGHPARRRRAARARRAGTRRGRARRVLRLARHDHVLRELRRALTVARNRERY